MDKNLIVKSLQENDIVMLEIPSMERNTLKQICRIYNLRFISDQDWLYFDGAVLYTNWKLHKSMLNDPMGNCMSITEKIDPKQLEQISRVNDMWKSDLYLLSDDEWQQKRNYLTARYAVCRYESLDLK